MRNKKRYPFGLFILLIILSAIVTLFVIRPDVRFCIRNAWNQFYLEADVKEIRMDPMSLQTLTVEDMKENQADIAYNQNLVLLNASHPMSEYTVPTLECYNGQEAQMDIALLDAFENLSSAVNRKWDEKLYIKSSYRSSQEQVVVYATDKEVAALPGASEHEAGLALDVYVKNFGGRAFIKVPAGQFVNEEGWRYGFITRYPLFKTAITGITYEPWHIRYVGKPHAEIMYKNSLCLEEYLESLNIGKFYEFDGYIISRQTGEQLQIPTDLVEVMVSPDNTGSYIVTGKIQMNN